MKKSLFYKLLVIEIIFTLISCNNKSNVEKAVEEMPLEMKVERFDEAFFATTPESLPKLKVQYPFFFPQGVEDKVVIGAPLARHTKRKRTIE